MAQRDEQIAGFGKAVHLPLGDHSKQEHFPQLGSRAMPTETVAARACREAVLNRCRASFCTLRDMIDLPAPVGPLAPVAALSQTDWITAEVTVSVGFFPDLAKLFFSQRNTSVKNIVGLKLL